jgi:LacI family transcriptional regulator
MEATQHLVDMGCRKIAHIQPGNPQNAIDRFIGYKKALEKMELCMILNWYIVVKMSLLKKGEFAKQITDDHSDVDGVL